VSSVIAAVSRPYRAVFRARFTLLLQYRAAALAGFVTQCWWGVIKIMVLAAFFRGAASTPMTLQQAIDYVWLGQAFLTLLPWSADPEIARMVRSGDVSYERLRPLDTYAFWYARAVARRTATPLLRAIPMVITAGVVLRLLGMSQWALSAPAGRDAALLFTVSMVLVVALSAAVTTLMDVLTVITLSDRGVNVLIGPLIIVFSGSLVPLPLFPDWMQRALALQPFAGLIDVPFRIYAGHLSASAAFGGLVRQAGWVIVFVLLGRWLMARAMARLETQGG
jgi:ABC-2 type transport system permease protein